MWGFIICWFAYLNTYIFEASLSDRAAGWTGRCCYGTSDRSAFSLTPFDLSLVSWWKLAADNSLKLASNMLLSTYLSHTSPQERSSHEKLLKTSDIIFHGYLPSRT